MTHHFEGKAIVVTGAGGSIGAALCHRLVDVGARRVTLVSLTESGLYRIERRLRAHIGSRKTELVPILGSVCDRGLMMEAIAGADIVIHAAAHKHVPICESNPLVAIENNVGGTYTLAQVAIARHVPQFVLISSDKAVHPSSIMGATKRVAEIILRDRLALQTNGTAFITVRFGNVLGSDGSVIPLWREQIARGGPLTLTDPGCERFFMSIDEAVELILGTASMEPIGGTFVFDMGEPRRLKDMAAEMIRESGQRIDIKYIGLRPGEKLTEELHFGGELTATEHPKIFIVHERGSSSLEIGWLLRLLGAVRNRDRDAAIQLLRVIAAA